MENMDRVEALYWNEKYKELEEHVIELADKLDLMELKEAKARMKIEELKKDFEIKYKFVRLAALTLGVKEVDIENV